MACCGYGFDGAWRPGYVVGAYITRIMETDNSLYSKIRAELTKVFPSSSGWLVEPMFARRDGQIYKATAPDHEMAVAIKVFTNENLRDQAPTQIFDALQFYHSKSEGTPILTVPKPFGVIADEGAVMMEWIKAPTMTSRLQAYRLSKNRRDRDVRNAARWLQWFHTQSGISKAVYDTMPSRKRFRRRARELETLDSGFLKRNPALSEHLEMWRKYNFALPEIELDHAITHHDFTPSNIFMERNRVVGFDLAGLKRWPVTFDICRFIVYLGIYRIISIPPGELRTYGCSKRDFECFAEAYGDGLTSIPRRVMLYLFYTEILRRWLSLAKQNIESSRFRRRLQIFHLKRMARHVSKGMLDSAALVIPVCVWDFPWQIGYFSG